MRIRVHPRERGRSSRYGVSIPASWCKTDCSGKEQPSDLSAWGSFSNPSNFQVFLAPREKQSKPYLTVRHRYIGKILEHFFLCPKKGILESTTLVMCRLFLWGLLPRSSNLFKYFSLIPREDTWDFSFSYIEKRSLDNYLVEYEIYFSEINITSANFSLLRYFFLTLMGKYLKICISHTERKILDFFPPSKKRILESLLVI